MSSYFLGLHCWHPSRLSLKVDSSREGICFYYARAYTIKINFWLQGFGASYPGNPNFLLRVGSWLPIHEETIIFHSSVAKCDGIIPAHSHLECFIFMFWRAGIKENVLVSNSNCNKCSGLKTIPRLSNSSAAEKKNLKWISSSKNQGVNRAKFLSGTSIGKVVSLLFPAA